MPASRQAPRSREGLPPSPEMRDAHAAFRRGSVGKPLVLFLLAVAAVVALVVFLPGGEDAKVMGTDKNKENTAVIGRSLPPYRTTLEEESAEDHRDAFRKAEEREREREAETAAPRPEGVPAEADFKEAFKKAAE